MIANKSIGEWKWRKSPLFKVDTAHFRPKNVVSVLRIIQNTSVISVFWEQFKRNACGVINTFYSYIQRLVGVRNTNFASNQNTVLPAFSFVTYWTTGPASQQQCFVQAWYISRLCWDNFKVSAPFAYLQSRGQFFSPKSKRKLPL